MYARNDYTKTCMCSCSNQRKAHYYYLFLIVFIVSTVKQTMYIYFAFVKKNHRINSSISKCRKSMIHRYQFNNHLYTGVYRNRISKNKIMFLGNKENDQSNKYLRRDKNKQIFLHDIT